MIETVDNFEILSIITESGPTKNFSSLQFEFT